MHRRALAFVASLALTFALAGPALGVTNAATTQVTVGVDAAISLTGVPLTIDFGRGLPGATLTAPTFTMHVTSTGPFTVKVDNLPLINGAVEIPTGRVTFKTNGVASGGTNIVLGTTTPLVESISLVVPSVIVSGTYTAVWTFTAETP